MVPRYSDHDQFLALIARLRAVAQKHDDTVFAEGLASCLLDASGGEPKCPMAALLIADYAETGRLPKIEDAHTYPRRPMNMTDPPPYDRRQLLEHLHRALADKAGARRDVRLLEALHDCEHTRQTNEHCPLHRLLGDSA